MGAIYLAGSLTCTESYPTPSRATGNVPSLPRVLLGYWKLLFMLLEACSNYSLFEEHRANILRIFEYYLSKYLSSHQFAKICRDRCPWVEGLHQDWADRGCGLGWSLWYHATSLSKLVVWKIVAQVPLEQANCTFSFFCSCRWSRTYAGGWCKNPRSRSRERDCLTQVEWT